MKKLQYSRVSEDWGEEEETSQDQITFVLPPPPVIRRSGVDKIVKRRVMSSAITDFFSPRPKRRKMERADKKSWSDEEGFLEATQEFVDDQCSIGGVNVVGGDERGNQEVWMEEFDIDNSFDEWTATFLGRESLGCGKRSVQMESSAADQYGVDDKSKDDLREALELKDRTVSSRDE